jgi:MATE family multidrug resistance protein
VAFVPMIGVNIAISTMVGQKLGENRPDLAARATWTAMALGMLYTGFFALLYVGVPGWFVAAHTALADDPSFPAVRETTILLLRFVALYCFFDATQIVLIGALRGAGDTRFILLATGAISAIAVLVGRICERAFDWNERGIALWGWWWILTAWIFALGVAYFLRFLGGQWREMRAIEPELLSGNADDHGVETKEIRQA